MCCEAYQRVPETARRKGSPILHAPNRPTVDRIDPTQHLPPLHNVYILNNLPPYP